MLGQMESYSYPICNNNNKKAKAEPWFSEVND